MMSAPISAGSNWPRSAKEARRRSAKSMRVGAGVRNQRVSIPGSSCLVEDDTAAAGRADQPRPLARVTESEGTAADRPRRHRDRATRTGGGGLAHPGLANDPLLLGLVLRLVAHPSSTGKSTGSIRF